MFQQTPQWTPTLPPTVLLYTFIFIYPIYILYNYCHLFQGKLYVMYFVSETKRLFFKVIAQLPRLGKDVLYC